VNDVAVLRDPFVEAKVKVDSGLVSPCEFTKGSLYFVVGEVYMLDDAEQNAEPAIQARTVSSCEGLNVELYRIALDKRRSFLKEDIPHGKTGKEKDEQVSPETKKPKLDRNENDDVIELE